MATKILYESLHPIIESILNKENVLKICSYIQQYLDRNVEILYITAPLYRLFFTDERERKFIYDILEIDGKMIQELTNKIPTINSSWKIMNDPFFIAMVLCIQNCEEHLTKNSYSSGMNKKMYESLEYYCMIFLALAMYSSLQFKYFRTPPNEDIMNYTINNMNNKFLIKQLGSLFKAIEHTTLVNHEKYKKNLLKMIDDDTLNYVINLRIRLNNFLKNIKKEYEDNRINKNYLSHEKESYDDDDYHINNSLSSTIVNVSQKVSLSFFTSGIKLDLVKLVCKPNQCEAQVLYNALGLIKDNETDKVKEIISRILEVYLNENPIESLKSELFVVKSIQIYNKSNTNDERVLKIKNILDIFLSTYCERYSHTPRPQTKANYRRALFYYFVMFIESTI